jgi:hypothetical protein
MSANFAAKTTDANKKIVDSIMTGADTYENMKEQLRAALSMPSVSRADETMRLPSADASQAVSLPEATPGEPRDIRVLYLHGNSRFEIEGTQAQLDAQEAALRAMYQK